MKLFITLFAITSSFTFIGCSLTNTQRVSSDPNDLSESRLGIIPEQERAVLPYQSKKKGIGTWGWRKSEKAMADLSQGASWYYTWWPHERGVKAPDTMEFVPMIYTREYAKDEYFEMAKQSPSGVLLGFNEPDRAAQANMSVEEALEHWPKFEETGLRLGSPAMADDETRPDSWMRRFLAGTDDYKPQVDFLCVHRYPHTRDPYEALNLLEEYLARVYRTFGLPIWLTEFSMIHFNVGPGGVALFPSDEEQAEFARKASELLESLPYVERYAWFVISPYRREAGFEAANFNLYDENGDVTEVGLAYRDSGRVLPRSE